MGWSPFTSRSAGSDGDELLLIDQIGDQSDVYEEPEKEAVLNKMVIRQLMDTLDETERADHPAAVF